MPRSRRIWGAEDDLAPLAFAPHRLVVALAAGRWTLARLVGDADRALPEIDDDVLGTARRLDAVMKLMSFFISDIFF
jgi:hypothetical protein